MSTDLPIRRARRPDYVLVLLLAFAAAIVFIELADPAPMDVEAALVTAP